MVKESQSEAWRSAPRPGESKANQDATRRVKEPRRSKRQWTKQGGEAKKRSPKKIKQVQVSAEKRKGNLLQKGAGTFRSVLYCCRLLRALRCAVHVVCCALCLACSRCMVRVVHCAVRRALRAASCSSCPVRCVAPCTSRVRVVWRVAHIAPHAVLYLMLYALYLVPCAFRVRGA